MFRNVLFEFLEVLECSFRISRKSRNSLMTSHRLMTSERDDHWMCWLMCRPIKGCAGWSTDDESPNIEEAGEKRKFKGDHRLRFPMIRKGVQSITQPVPCSIGSTLKNGKRPAIVVNVWLWQLRWTLWLQREWISAQTG